MITQNTIMDKVPLVYIYFAKENLLANKNKNCKNKNPLINTITRVCNIVYTNVQIHCFGLGV